MALSSLLSKHLSTPWLNKIRQHSAQSHNTILHNYDSYDTIYKHRQLIPRNDRHDNKLRNFHIRLRFFSERATVLANVSSTFDSILLRNICTTDALLSFNHHSGGGSKRTPKVRVGSSAVVYKDFSASLLQKHHLFRSIGGNILLWLWLFSF